MPEPGRSPASASPDRYHHRRPLDADFYAGLIAALPPRGEAGTDGRPARTATLARPGAVFELGAGDLIALTQKESAQVVLLYAWDAKEPRERIWCQETSSLENCFLVPTSRLWGKMPWFTALLTVLEDTIESADGPGSLQGRHHFVLDGWEVPALWAADGGDSRIPSGWESIDRLLHEHGIDPRLHRDHVALFRKVAIDPDSQVVHVLPSDARAGDRVVLYAEKDVRVALVPSPYRDDARSAAELDGEVAAVRVDVWPSGTQPLGWPYPDVAYPDIRPYVDGLDGGMP